MCRVEKTTYRVTKYAEEVVVQDCIGGQMQRPGPCNSHWTPLRCIDQDDS